MGQTKKNAIDIRERQHGHKKIGQRVGLLAGKAGELGLTLQQKEFCELYTSSSMFLGNGTQSYLEAYARRRGKKITRDSANQLAGALLSMPYITEYINYLLEQQKLTDDKVDAQLGFLVNQHQNLYVKLGGITEYNKLKKRVGNNTPEGNKTLIIVVSPETAERYNLTPTEVTQK